MENKKICKHCGKEKDVAEFPTYLKASTGETCYRNVCRSCRTIQINKSKGLNIQPKKTYSYNTHIKEDNSIQDIDDDYEPKSNIYNFSEEQLNNLKLIADNANKIMNLLNKKVDMSQEIDKARRIPKTINLNIDIYNKIQDYCKEKSLSISDVINGLLAKALKNLE